MALLILQKTTTGKVIHTFDFVDLIPTSVTITARSVTATDSSGTDVSASIVTGSGGSGTNVTAILQAGTNLEDYLVTYEATLSDAQKRHKQVELRVRSTLQP